MIEEERPIRPEHRVKIDNGKYEFVYKGFGVVDILRDGQPWRSQIQAGRALRSMMRELDAARVVVQGARDTLRYVSEGLTPWAGLQRALALHDRLTADDEPPSALALHERMSMEDEPSRFWDALKPQVNMSDGETVRLNVTRDELRRIVACVRRDAAVGPLCAEAETLALADKLLAGASDRSPSHVTTKVEVTELFRDGWFAAHEAIGGALVLLRPLDYSWYSATVLEIISQARSALSAAQSKIKERVGG